MTGSAYVQAENCSCVFGTSHIHVRRMNGIPLKGVPSGAESGMTRSAYVQDERYGAESGMTRSANGSTRSS